MQTLTKEQLLVTPLKLWDTIHAIVVEEFIEMK